jgi:hypothetical protein
VIETFEKYNAGGSFDAAFRQRFDQDPPEDLNENHYLIIVASELDASTERIVEYVSDYGVPINVVFFQHFHDGEREYLARSWLSDPEEVETRASKAKPSGPRKARPPWNKQDFYVSSGIRRFEDQTTTSGDGRTRSNTASSPQVGGDGSAAPWNSSSQAHVSFHASRSPATSVSEL